MKARRDVFQAIADPRRREIINLLANRGMNLNTIAEHFDVSRPAISQHIKILTECGLVAIRQQGRERYCEAKLQQLNQVADWVGQYRKFWTAKLDGLERFLEETDKPEPSRKHARKLKRKRNGKR